MRVHSKHTVFHVTNRTNEFRYFFVPTKEVTNKIRSLLRIGAAFCKIGVHAATFMSNHFHLLLSDPHGNMGRFMGYLQGNLARFINKLYGRTGCNVFPRRYHSEAILDEESFERTLEYIWTNPVRAHIVESPEEYPGFCTFNQSAGLDTSHPIDLSIPKMWRHLTAEERFSRVKSLVKPTVDAMKVARTHDVIGAKKCQELHWSTVPQDPKPARPRSPRCHAVSKERRDEYRAYLRRIREAYREARQRQLQGCANVKFPHGTNPPGSSRTCVHHDRFVPPKIWRLG